MKNRYLASLLSDSLLLVVAALTMIIGAILFTFSSAHSEVRPENVGQVKAFRGSVTMTRAYTKESLKVDGQLPVMFRDLSETDFDSQVEIQFKDGSTLVIGEDTVLSIDDMVYDPKTGRRSTTLNLMSGTIRVKATKNRNPESKFEVTTPSIVAGIRGTEFTVSVDKAGNARVITLEGAVAVWKQGALKGSRKEVLVVAGMTTGMAPGDAAPTDAKAATAKQIKTVTSATRMDNPAPKKKSGKIRTASAAPKGKGIGQGGKVTRVAAAIKSKNRLGGIKVASLKSTLKANARVVSRGAARSTAVQAAKNAAKNVAKIAARNVAKEAAIATVKEVARKAASEAARSAARSAASNVASNVAKNAAKNAAKEVASNAASEAAKNNAKNNGNNGKAKGKNK